MAAAIKASLEGAEDMTRRVQAIASDKGLRKEMRSAVVDVAQTMLDAAKADCPVRTGRLRDSGKLRVLVSPKKEDVRMTIVFGGQGIPYAFKQHEENKQHPKFLEKVILAGVGTAAAAIAEKIDLRKASEP